MKPVLSSFALLLALAGTAGQALAQDGPRVSRSAVSGRSLGGAILGAGVTALVGGFVGASIASSACEPGFPDECLGRAYPGFLIGFGVGHTIGAPLGAHLLNGRRGDIGRSLLVSAGVFAAEVVALNALIDDGQVRNQVAVLGIAAAAPVIQVITSAIIEHRTAPR